MTNGRDSPGSLGRGRRSSGRSASLLWPFRRVLLTLVSVGSAASSSMWRRRFFSSARWWSGFTLEVGFLFGRFGSSLALPATRDVDGATWLEWLSIDGVADGWIDVGGDSRLGLAGWRKKGDLISCILVALVAWVVPFASPASVGLLMLGRCGFGPVFEARPRSLPCWAVTLFFLCFVFQFVLVFGSIFRSQISPDSTEFWLLSEICVRDWFWVSGSFLGPNRWTTHSRAIDYQPALMMLTLMSMLNARTSYPKGTPDQLCCFGHFDPIYYPSPLLLGSFDWSAYPLLSEDM